MFFQTERRVLEVTQMMADLASLDITSAKGVDVQ